MPLRNGEVLFEVRFDPRAMTMKLLTNILKRAYIRAQPLHVVFMAIQNLDTLFPGTALKPRQYP